MKLNQNIPVALYIVNRGAKGVEGEFQHQLYNLKGQVLKKLLDEGHATEVGLHKAITPGYSASRCDVLIQVGDFGFHRIAKKSDYKNLRYIGERGNYRNPKCYMSLRVAQTILKEYLGDSYKEIKTKRRLDYNQYYSISGYLS